jgi:uncharacterized protein (DUF1778 family)
MQLSFVVNLKEILRILESFQPSILFSFDEIIRAGWANVFIFLILSYTRHTEHSMATSPRTLKSQRINARLSDAEEALLRRGARHKGQTITEFVVQSACAVAELELAEQKEFTLPPAQWQAFLAALDKPTVPSPALRRLLTEPSVIELANKK